MKPIEILSKVVEFREFRNTRQKNITLSDQAVAYAIEDIAYYLEELPPNQKKKFNFSTYIEMLIHIMHRNTNLARGVDIV